MSTATTDWAIPQQAKLKYTQLFNLHDRARSGFLSGLQCRDILLQSGLPRNILAEIWNLSDIDGDGQLTREEFILAMHLTNQVRSGQKLPSELPPDLVPPSYRRTRSVSGTSVNSGTSAGGSSTLSGNIQDVNSIIQQQQHQQLQKSFGPADSSAASSFAAGSVLNSNSFEDKRRENYEKGRAELEKRRLKVIEQQSAILKEQLAGCKKQVADAKAKIDSMRSERDTKMGLITSLEAQLQTVRDRRAYLAHEEQNLIAIAKDLNLVQNSNSTNQAELDQLATQAKQENINQMKQKLKEFEKENCEKKNELEEVKKRVDDSKVQLRSLIDNVGKSYETYKDKVASAKIVREQIIEENKSKTIDLDSVWDSAPAFGDIGNQSRLSNNNNTTSATTPRPESTTQLKSTEDPWASHGSANDQSFSFASPANDDAFGGAFSATTGQKSNEQPSSSVFGDGFGEATPGITSTVATNSSITVDQQLGRTKKFRALYAFEARNHDELTINPGDIIIGSDVVCEPGWLSGECNGRSGLFPEAYVEPLPNDFADVLPLSNAAKSIITSSSNIETTTPKQTFSNEVSSSIVSNMPRYKCIYAFEARNTDELTINPGDIINGVEGIHEPGWLMGELDGTKGLFPEAYVEQIPAATVKPPTQPSQSESAGVS